MKTKLLTLTAVACLFVATVSNAQVPSYVPTNGLVGWWPLNGNANDLSANSNNGIASNMAWGIDRFGNANSAADFNLVANRVISVSNPIGVSGNSKTISIWFKLPSTINNGSLYNQMLRAGAPGLGDLECMVYGNLSAYIANNYVDKIGFNSNVPTNQVVANNLWHNVIFLADGITDSLSIFIDGQLNLKIGIPQYNYSNWSYIYFGNFPPFGALSQTIFAGVLDDIGVWNRTLTQQEIINVYENGCTQPAPVSLGTSSTTILCPNDTVEIFVVSPAANPVLTYQWTRNGNNVLGAIDRSIKVNDIAKYKVFVRSGPGSACQRVSGLIETQAATPPQVAITAPNGTTLCPGDSVMLVATGATAGYSYQWRKYGSSISGAISDTFYVKSAPVGTGTGIYTCAISNPGGCISVSNKITITNGTSCRIMQDQSSDVSVYPNPAQNSFTVTFNDIGNEIPVSIELRNLRGQSIENRKLNELADVQFNVGKLSPGMYMVRIMLESGDLVEKSVMVE